jgi:hypothetical protein
MRKWITLVERAALPFELSDEFCAKVHEYLDEHLADWSDDYADPEVMRTALEPLVQSIFHYRDGNDLEIYRKELRPQDQIDDLSFGTLGHCWSWDSDGAQVCHHDNAYDQYGRDNLTEVMFVADVTITDVDWVQTLAKNLVLRNEREISVEDGKSVRVKEMFFEKGYKTASFTIPIDRSGDF